MGKLSKYVFIILLPILFLKYADDIRPAIQWSELKRKYHESKSVKKHGPPGPMYDGCNTCLWKYCSPAIQGVDNIKFVPSSDAQELANCLSGMDKIKLGLMDILVMRSDAQRNAIHIDFNREHKESLASKIKDKLNYKYRYTKLMRYLAMPLPEFYAKEFSGVFKKLKDSKEDNLVQQKDLVEMFAILPNCLLRKVILAYNTIYTAEFVSDLRGSLKGLPESNVVDVFAGLAQRANRGDSTYTSWFLAWREAKKLHKAVKTHNFQDINKHFSEIFTKRSIPQLRETIIIYEKLRKNEPGFSDMIEDIRRVHQKGVLIYETLTKIAKDSGLYFAAKLKNLLFAEDYTTSNRFILFIRARSGVDLKDIQVKYFQANSEKLVETFLRVEKNQKSDYVTAMKSILKDS